MKICPQCRAQFEDDMNFCLQDGTPLLEEDQFSNPTESFSEQTINLPTAPNLPPTIAPTQGYFAAGGPPTAAQTEQLTAELNNQPTAASKMETSPIFASLATDSGASKSRSGLAVASFAGILILLGTALGGVWWYSQSGKNTDVALANTNSQNPSTVINQNADSGFSNESNSTESNSTNQSNQTESSLRPNSNGNTKLSTPTPTEPAKPTPTKETEVNPTPKTVVTEVTEPPPPVKTPTPTPKPVPKTISGGVVNGKATYLAKPTYPPAARAVGASGAVSVQVTIDESGNVISATAVSGHPLLRSSAESAARSSKFSPTVLAGQPVKVTGVIVYNFVP